MLHQPLNCDVTATLLEEAIERSRAQVLDIGDLLGFVEKLKTAGGIQQVVELYKAWIAFNPDHPLLYAAYYNYGMALADASDMPAAVNALRASIRLKPDFYPPYINLGNILERLGKRDRAVLEWMGLVNMFPSVTGESIKYKTLGLKQIGRVLEAAQSDAAAEDVLRQSLEIDSNQPDVVQHWISLRMRQCKWPILPDSSPVETKKLTGSISPLSLACLADDPIFQLATAFEYNKESIGYPRRVEASKPDLMPGGRSSRKLRIGYVSSDFREHAVGFSMTDVIESHDRRNFDIFTYYCGIPGSDSTRQRIEAATDSWIDLNGLDDEAAATKIRADGIDILVDLNGYTKDARTKVFALRPAPIAVNWFGFPGTMASTYHHYIIADPIIIPESHELYYSEKVLRLPCYQPNDRKRVVAAQKTTRRDENLPDDAFVFCCLNGSQKLTASTFERWMAILRGVPNGVLWLLTSADETNQRLRQRAEEHGVAPSRLIFAEKKPNPAHLARYPLADLFLDTFPYGAHTTAADAMWMGVPVLTAPGRSFASRVCASLVHAADIGELVCSSANDYVERAIEFGRDRAKLNDVKAKLASARDTCLLFDTPKLIMHLEDLYRQMWSDFMCGELPRPDLTNLDVYHGIGMGQALESIEQASDDEYHGLYRRQLAERHDNYPLGWDKRLWQN